MWLWLIPLTLLVLLEALADIFAKEWSLRGTHPWWIAAIGAYIAANIFWLFALKNGSGLARGGIIFSVASAMLAAGIGIVLYHESLTRLQLTGVVIGIFAIILIFSE